MRACLAIRTYGRNDIMRTYSAKTVVFFLFDGVAPFDVAGPAQVFRGAGEHAYSLSFVSSQGGSVETDCPPLALGSLSADAAPEGISTLVIPGTHRLKQALEDPAAIEAIRDLAGRASRIATVCTGAFLAVEAGLVRGRRIVTHWRWCEELARRYPDIKVEPDAIWVNDGPIWSSAGVSAGVDLALSIVEADFGSRLAADVAKSLVVFLRRPGGQLQFSRPLLAQSNTNSSAIDRALAWAAANLDKPVRIDELAKKSGMSPRHFARRFRTETGTTPGRAVMSIRLDAARLAVESNDQSLAQIAVAFGFGTERHMRRSFVEHFGMPPGELRARFR